ncbi:MAG: hypothetical protein MUC68_05555 [Burkholderiaceae bacterium]|nr:hypothetical protein [Burkholderiaceae bacterium]
MPHVRLVLALALLALLGGCVTVHGPRTLTLTREDLERAVEADLGKLIEVVRGLDGRRPEVAFMPVSNRVELAWTFTVPAEPQQGATLFGSNIGVAVIASGRPQLNPARTGVDLTDMRLDEVRVLGLPRLLGFGFGRLADKQGSALPDVPLLQFTPTQLRVADVAYGATTVQVTYRGLEVGIEPR